ncbi:MAG: DUF2807 domain-containing protein [Bacteroidetes bacterium]|nr:DUF2807 domain-containing protein [Bacteroidota bacterium]MCL2301674.1 DUF2807 domain-containing protein [Lentimicrobiaceae bacterium]
MKKTKKLSLLLIVAIAILLSACHKDCKDDKLTQREVSITDKIKGIIIEGPWDVTITQDSANNKATLEYCVSVENKIKSELLSNGYLRIRISSTGNSNCRTYRATINAALLEKIEASGAATIRTYGIFNSHSDISLSGASKINGLVCKGDYARLTLSGASKLENFTFTGNSMEATLSGASVLKFSNVDISSYCTVAASGASTLNGSGYASKTTFTGSGASTFKTLSLESENLDIELSGASTAEATVNNSIKGKLTGASILRYQKATNVNVDVEGGSKLIRID